MVLRKTSFFMFSVLLILAGSILYCEEKAPEINAQSWKNTDSVSLDSLKGKKGVVVEFWSTYCPPCRKTTPHLVELYNKYKDKNIEFIGLTGENDASKVSDFIDKYDIPYPIGIGSSSGKDYGVKGIPHAFVIDPEGSIMWHGHPAVDEFEENLEKLAEKTSGLSTEPETKISKEEVLKFLQESKNNLKELSSDEIALTEFFEEIPMVLPYRDDRKVTSDFFDIANRLINRSKIDYAKVETAKFLKNFENNSQAAQILISAFSRYKRNYISHETLVNSILKSLGSCAKYNGKVPQILDKVFEGGQDVSTDLRKNTLDTLGEIRTVQSVKTLINLMPVICFKAHKPNPYIHYLYGDQAKHHLWQELAPHFYGAINKLTGEAQSGDAYDGVYWPYSKWKRWFNKHKSRLRKEFYREQKEAIKSESK